MLSSTRARQSHLSPSQEYTLSEYERLALGGRINLSDGHARMPLSEPQREILRSTLSLFDAAVSRPQAEIECEFLGEFFKCASQEPLAHNLDTFLTFSSSSAIKMVAQYCRIQQLTVCLLEPCFDNIVHILRTEGVRVQPVREEDVVDITRISACLSQQTALWLVQPNNPTGFCLDRDHFDRVIRIAAARRATVIIDYCFRLYAEALRWWDQYLALKESGVTFVCIEDTGKTWSLADTKVGITVCSADAASLIYRLHDQLLLNVSPLHLLLLTEFIKHTLAAGVAETLLDHVERNRQVVHTLVSEGLLCHRASACHNVPMELLGLRDASGATRFWSVLRERGIDVLPAENYFWSRPLDGRTLFRVPLSRPCRDIDAAIPVMRETLRSM
jgi:aspartate/methionine/tyrosine aminotransferase